MPDRRFWTFQRDGTNGWCGAVRFGRLQLQLHVLRHRGRLPDRWVLQPHVIYDRKKARA